MATIPETQPTAKPHRFYKSLYFQVIVGIILGVLLGAFYPSLGEQMKPLGDAFIKLIKMIIASIIFFTVVVGIAGIGDMKKLGRVGGFITLAATLSTVGTIPIAGIARLLGVDRFMS